MHSNSSYNYCTDIKFKKIDSLETDWRIHGDINPLALIIAENYNYVNGHLESFDYHPLFYDDDMNPFELTLDYGNKTDLDAYLEYFEKN